MSMSGEDKPIDGRRHRLQKRETLRGHEAFSHVLSQGKQVVGMHLRGYFLEVDSKFNNGIPVRVGFAVNRRVRSAVARNRVRRLMREAYRRNKGICVQTRGRENKFFSVVLMYRGDDVLTIKKLRYADIESDARKILGSVFRST